MSEDASPTASPELSAPATAPAVKQPAVKPPAKKAAVKTAAKKTTAAKTAPAKKAPAKNTAKRATAAKRTPAKKAPPSTGSVTGVRSRGPHAPDAPAAAGPVVHLSLAEREAHGLSWRAKAPLADLAQYEPAGDRPDPVEILRAQDQTRVQELVPVRYGRMSASAFAFYRGTAAVMAADLATLPRTPNSTQICGDAHLSNFGVFAAPDRKLVFDLNDFDETLAGPFEWDVRRLAASFVLAARDRGFDKKVARNAASTMAAAYRATMHALAEMATLDIWYARVDEPMIMSEIDSRPDSDATMRKRVTATFDKARARTSLRASERLTEEVDGRRQFREDPPLISREVITDSQREHARGLFRLYRRTLQNDRRHLLERYALVDAARKVVGVGSVGTRAYVLLLDGRDGSDPLILQAKQAQASVLEPYLGRSPFRNSGQRVVEGQRYMQAASDIFLGWVKGEQGEFYVRQLHDMKGSFDVTKARPVGLVAMGRLCGMTLARAHARSGDAVAIAAYLGQDDTFDRAIGKFARRYADQAERDYAELQQQIADGRIEAHPGI